MEHWIINGYENEYVDVNGGEGATAGYCVERK
jgi:hypothetical protein